MHSLYAELKSLAALIVNDVRNRLSLYSRATFKIGPHGGAPQNLSNLLFTLQNECE